jgi:non-lysosomal glucosylceramidase
LSFKEGDISGVNMIHQLRYKSGEVASGQLTDRLSFTIAGTAEEGENSYIPAFDPTVPEQNAQIWSSFSKSGSLNNVCNISGVSEGKVSTFKQTLASAVCIKVKIPANSSKEITFALSWDLPITRCGHSSHYKRYTNFYGKEARSGLENIVSQKIAIDALANFEQWINLISEWQKPILSNNDLPDWYKSTLFNELYYIVDGGTVWTDGSVEEVQNGIQDLSQHFSYLEGHEYVMFTTYDVHFYASNALIMNWPQIQLCIQRDFANSSEMELDEQYKWCGTGTYGKRKIRNTIPHDLGTTCENPWVLVNAYNVQNTNRWKDLNCHFVLTCFRDYTITQDILFLEEMWPRIESVVTYHIANFDKDGDDLIENEGYPDSTYDVWTTTGPSAYCGGLWISTLASCEKIAQILSEHNNDSSLKDKSIKYGERKVRAVQAYEQKLWNDKGGYYNYDSNPQNVYYDTIMSDQLAGHFMLRLCKVEPILQYDHVRSSLNKIYELNVQKYAKITGLGGAVNGMRPNGLIDTHFMQSKEVWTGTTYLLAATLMIEGMTMEAFATAKGIFDVSWNRMGYWFQTPEAYDEKGHFRSGAYMRPLSIWAIQAAIQHKEIKSK